MDNEEWYGYVIPTDPRYRPIRVIGPVKKVVAEKWKKGEEANTYYKPHIQIGLLTIK
jgi:hypothetical protein